MPTNGRSQVWKDAAVCHAQHDDFGKARDIFEEVLPVAMTLKGGETNALTLDILNNYGKVCRKLGEFEKAEYLLNAAVQSLQSRKGTGDGLYLNAAENLGNLLADKGSHRRAREIFELCLTEAKGYDPQRASHIKERISELENLSG